MITNFGLIPDLHKQRILHRGSVSAPHGIYLLGVPNIFYFAYFGQFISPNNQGYKIPQLVLDLALVVIVFLVVRGLLSWIIAHDNYTQVFLCFLGR